MAPALRMTAPDVACLTTGRFGAAVAADLGDRVRVLDAARLDGDRGGAYLLVASPPAPALAERVDAHPHSLRVPWLAVVLEHPQLRVGPAVVPGHGACY